MYAHNRIFAIDVELQMRALGCMQVKDDALSRTPLDILPNYVDDVWLLQ